MALATHANTTSRTDSGATIRPLDDFSTQSDMALLTPAAEDAWKIPCMQQLLLGPIWGPCCDDFFVASSGAARAGEDTGAHRRCNDAIPSRGAAHCCQVHVINVEQHGAAVAAK
mmetsp:Transcript_62787/g.137509  ORF Transcript_62787/g.137509 Transcript_62787/m.137509 type:complete len:114 (+) Transcript_62787:771-1112(+)